MSQFNLMPNPTIVGIQFCIFMIVLVIIRNFFLKPYKLLREKRQALTIGTKQEGEALFEKNEQLLNEIDTTIKEGQKQAKELYQEISSSSKAQSEKLVIDSEKNLQQELQKIQEQIRNDMKEVHEEVINSSKKISKEVYNKIYNV